MKRILMALMIAALAAGTAFAQEGNDEQADRGGKSWNPGSGGPQGWERGDRDRGNGGDRQEWSQDKRGGRPEGPMDEAMMEQMKAYHKTIKELGDAARAVTNEAAKAEIVSQLRAKLGEVADLMQKKWEERLTQAEDRLAGLKAKIEDSKANRDKLIEDQVQRILSGERPMHHGSFPGFPNAKGGMPEGGPAYRGLPPPPPPPGEEMPEDMPPPPAE